MKLGRAEVITRSGSVALATVYDKLGRLTFGYCYLHGLFYLVFHYNYIKHNLFRCEDSKIGMLNTLLLTGVIVILWPRLLVINPERSNMATPVLSAGVYWRVVRAVTKRSVRRITAALALSTRPSLDQKHPMEYLECS